MYLLDTDHISIFDRGGSAAHPLLTKLSRIDPNQVATTIITYEEQNAGVGSATLPMQLPIEAQIAAYRKLESQLANYRNITVISFDDSAGQIFQALRKSHPRLGSMDLKIAAIALANQATVLTRNRKDFGQIANLSIADWTV